MRLTTLTTILIAFLITGCSTIQPKRIVYNGEKGIYEYRLNRKNSITLRNQYQQLVDTSNYGHFKDELASIKNRYPFKKRLEVDNLLKKSDFELSKRYGTINQLIIEGDYQKSLVGLNRLSSLYPDIYKYSDCDYLKGFAFEKLGCADSIKIMGGHLLKYSSLKFSSKFHGQREFDFNDQIYTFQRQYAINYYLNREQTHFEPCIF